MIIRPVRLAQSLAVTLTATAILAPTISAAAAPDLLAHVPTATPATHATSAASTTRPAIEPTSAPPAAAASADASVETHSSSIGGLTLPAFIGPLEYIGAQSGADRLTMATYSYRAMGLALDIHVTDLGAGGIADGIESAELMRRYADAKTTPSRRPAFAASSRTKRVSRWAWI